MTSDIFNLHEYKKNKKIVKEIPKVIKILDDFQQKLYPYMHYFAIGHLNNAINPVKETLEIHLKSLQRKIKNDD